ncbi:MAG: hypothetical protein C5B59_12725 [Bacteroidetes bacterium]|nr:MAG: hypothetical protein C5B59_12725 [Bacteroidota bacterium]
MTPRTFIRITVEHVDVVEKQNQYRESQIDTVEESKDIYSQVIVPEAFDLKEIIKAVNQMKETV